MTDNYWNSKILKPPPINSFKCKSPAIDLNSVISILVDGVDTFIIPNALAVESTVMRRVIYRLKLQFRQDKGFKLFEATNRYLNNLFSYNITRDLMYFLEQIPKKYEKDIYLPSKQMLQYVLVRLQGYGQVCGRVVEAAFQTACMVKNRMSVGNQWQTCIVMFAISCRIWQMCRQLTTKCCLLFNDLLPLLDKLQITGSEWLPSGYKFPKDLVTWLRYDWLLEIPDIIVQLPLELPVFSLLDDDDDIQYAGRYECNKNSTVFVIDSDDDDDSENVQFVCQLTNTSMKLSKEDVKTLAIKSINLDSESDVCSYLDISDDSDVQIIETDNNNEETVSKNLNISGVEPLDEIIEIDTTPVLQRNNKSVEEEDAPPEEEEAAPEEEEAAPEEEVVNEEVPEEDNEHIFDNEDEDLGVSVTHVDKKLSNKEEEEIIILSGLSGELETVISDDDNLGEPITRDDENNEPIDDENIEPATNDDENDEPTTTNDENNEPIPKSLKENWIYVNGNKYYLKNRTHVECLLDQESILRSEGSAENCVFSHIEEDDWNYLSYQIRYLLALTIDNPKCKKAIFFKIKTMLNDLLNNDLDFNYIMLPKNKEYMHELSLANKGKIFLINSIKSTKHLQIFLESERKIRQTLYTKRVYNNLENNDWHKLYSSIKCLIVTANSKPMRRMYCIKRAKTILFKLIKYDKDSYKSNPSDSDSSDCGLKERTKMFIVYKSNTICPNWNELSDYFHVLLEYKDPPKLSKILKRKKQAKDFPQTIMNTTETTKTDSPSKKQKTTQKRKLVYSTNNEETPTSSPKRIKMSSSPKRIKMSSPPKNLERVEKMNQLFEHVKAQEDYIVTPKKNKRNKGKNKNNQSLTNFKQETPGHTHKKLSKSQKKRLRLENEAKNKINIKCKNGRQNSY